MGICSLKTGVIEVFKKEKKKSAVKLGIVRLESDYPPAPGDIGNPESFNYDVSYRMIPGFTFAVCMSGKMLPEVEQKFVETIKWFD